MQFWEQLTKLNVLFKKMNSRLLRGSFGTTERRLIDFNTIGPLFATSGVGPLLAISKNAGLRHFLIGFTFQIRKLRTPILYSLRFVKIIWVKSIFVFPEFSTTDRDQSLQDPAVCQWRVTGPKSLLHTSVMNLDPQTQSKRLFLL